MGKTAFALNIAQYVAMQTESAVGIFSLEMAKEQLVMRMLCAEARVDNAKVRAGYLAESGTFRAWRWQPGVWPKPRSILMIRPDKMSLNSGPRRAG